MKPTLKIDIVSDVVCPWCYIGKRRIEKALVELAETYDFEVEYHPYELNAGMPVEGVNQKKYLVDKFGGEERYNQIQKHVTGVAQEEGLTFAFEKQEVSPNTRKAHALIQYAKEQGKQLEVVEAFFKAYFTDGVDLSKDENLKNVAVNCGLDSASVNALLNNENASIHIQLIEQELSKLGISGVPFYIINNRYGISGAQPTATFIKAIQEIGNEPTPSGNSCDTNSAYC